ncbi:MAG: hypothetical protein ACTS73_01700 [Arsenophonus sp. NEOnobi-MAG3]
MYAVIRNGYLPQRSIQITIGNVEIKVPTIIDRSGNGNMLQHLVATELSEACKNRRSVATSYTCKAYPSMIFTKF